MPASKAKKPDFRVKDGQVVLGIDPGLVCMGWGVVLHPNTYIASGIFRPRGKNHPRGHDARLSQIYREVARLVEEYKPDRCSIEDQYFAHSKPTALKVAQAKGAAIAGFGSVPHRTLTPSQVKMRCTGHGSASKEDVARAISRMMAGAPQEFKSFDASDSLGIAWAA